MREADLDEGHTTPLGLSELLSCLARLLSSHPPESLVLLPRETLERTELTAYASGWRDAAEEYEQAIAQAREEGRIQGRAESWSGRRRPLRAVDGPTEVIDFPLARRLGLPEESGPPGNGSVPGPRPGHPAGDETSTSREKVSPESSPEPTSNGARTGRRPGGDTGAPPAPAPRYSFAPKSRGSKTPTIPRLTPPRRRPPTTEDDPDGAPLARRAPSTSLRLFLPRDADDSRRAGPLGPCGCGCEPGLVPRCG
jgi:hypothetical protein